MRWFKDGDPGTGPIRAHGGNRVCRVDGCNKPYSSKGYCAPHYKRVVKYGDPGPAEITPRSVGDAANYGLIHLRLAKQRGSAKARDCVSCGGQARHWAYDHEDPNERIDSRGYAFSLDLNHYRPMCVTCHKRFDMGRLAARPVKQ